jgi:2'-5' RNA ligase
MADQRLFIAVNLSPEIKSTIQQALDDFPVKQPPWRWVRTNNLHLTMKFLGDTPEAVIPRLADTIDMVVENHRPFEIRLDRLGGFPNLRKPRVLFYRISEGAGPLGRLARELNQALEDRLDLPAERKPFRAHITVARIKRPLPPEVTARLAEAPPLPPVSQMVTSVDLMHSQLRREGAVYNRLKEIALK